MRQALDLRVEVRFAPPDFRSALERTLDRFERKLEALVHRFNALHETASSDPMRGLYATEEDIARLFAPVPLPFPGQFDPLVDLHDDSRLVRLTRIFELSQAEADLLFIAMAPALEPKYERVFGYLQDDMTRRRATVDFALGLIFPSRAEKWAGHALLTPASKLLTHGLVRLLDDPQDREPPLHTRLLAVDERIVQYVLGMDELDERLRRFVRQLPAHDELDALVLPDEFRQRLLGLKEHGQGTVLYLHGSAGSGKKSIARSLAAEFGRDTVLAVDGRNVPTGSEAFEAALAYLRREARLLNAAILWEHSDTYWNAAENHSAQQQLPRLLAALADITPILMAGAEAWRGPQPSSGLRLLTIELPEITSADRETLWSRALAHSPAELVELSTLSSAFRLLPGQIVQAAATAPLLAAWRGTGKAEVAASDILAACRMQASPHLATLARRVRPHHQWDDLVLPEDRIQQLRELCNHLRYRGVVHDQWGFAQKLALGKGVAALFAGPSGTGKTMAASIIAAELGLDLYKIDLATLVSKYIGETEKNLARIFSEAETSNAILFFDEADALFGKRSEVKDAHDRYANLEVAYLLQRIEEYHGAVILATNLGKNLDDAFVRRMHFIVQFPVPNEQQRQRIWQQIWPSGTPLEPHLDLDFMARRCEIAGGNIRNVALQSAFLAASDGRALAMEHLIQATRREYQKMGRVVSEAEFAQYE